MYITKAHLEKTVKFIFECYEAKVIEELKEFQSNNGSFYEYHRKINELHYYYSGRLWGLSELFFMDYPKENQYISECRDRFNDLSNRYSQTLLEISNAKRYSEIESAVFAPATESIETVYLPADVTPIQEGVINPSCVEHPAPSHCLYCHEEYIPITVFGDNDGYGLKLSSYCSDECWHAHGADQKKQICEAA